MPRLSMVRGTWEHLNTAIRRKNGGAPRCSTNTPYPAIPKVLHEPEPFWRSILNPSNLSLSLFSYHLKFPREGLECLKSVFQATPSSSHRGAWASRTRFWVLGWISFRNHEAWGFHEDDGAWRHFPQKVSVSGLVTLHRLCDREMTAWAVGPPGLG